MKLVYQPTQIILNVFTPQMPQGQSFEVFVPEWTRTVAIDKDGKINAFASPAYAVDETSDSWDTNRQWDEVADLEFVCDNWRDMKFALTEFDSENRVGGVFEVRIGA